MKTQQTAAGLGCLLLLALMARTTNAATLNHVDKEFMMEAARANMTEAHEGQVCQQRATQDNVKALAKTLDEDHTKAYEELSVLAAKLGVGIPKGINIAKDAAFERMVHLKGEKFDHEFITDEIAAHKHAIDVFKREADHGTDTDVKAYASKMIPILENHLQAAEACAKTVKHS